MPCQTSWHGFWLKGNKELESGYKCQIWLFLLLTKTWFLLHDNSKCSHLVISSHYQHYESSFCLFSYITSNFYHAKPYTRICLCPFDTFYSFVYGKMGSNYLKYLRVFVFMLFNDWSFFNIPGTCSDYLSRRSTIGDVGRGPVTQTQTRFPCPEKAQRTV